MAGSGKPILINELICALYLSVTAKPVSTLFGFPEIGIQLKMGFYPLCSGCGLNSVFCFKPRSVSSVCKHHWNHWSDWLLLGPMRTEAF